MNLLEAFIIFASAVLSGMLFFLFPWNSNKLKLLLSLSGAYLFAITVLHLIPEIYSTGDHLIGIYLFCIYLPQGFQDIKVTN